MTAGRCAGPRNGSRSRSPPRSGGPTATASWRGRHGRPVLAPGPLVRGGHPTRTERRIIKVRVYPAVGSGPDRLPAGPGKPSTVHGSCPATAARAWPGPTGPPEPDREPPLGQLRPRRARRPGPRRHQEARPDPRRRRPQGPGPQPRATGTGSAGPATAFLHNAVDDHSRLAYSEILADERKETAAAFWQRARACFAAAGITVQRVLTDNGSCYRSRPSPRPLGTGIPTSGPGPTGPRPTARSSGSTAPCSTNGPTPGPTAPRPSASPASPTGCTPTTTTAATPHSAATTRSRVPNLVVSTADM